METSLGQSALYVNKIFSAEQMLAIGEIRRLSCRPGFPCLGIRRFCSFRSSTWLGIRRFSSVEGKDSIFAEAAKTPSSSSRFGKWAEGNTVIGVLTSGAILSGVVSIFIWCNPSPYLNQKEDKQELRKHLRERKIKAVEDCFVKNQMQAKPSITGIPKIDRTDILLATSIESIVNIEGPPGIGKSSYFAEVLEAENAKGTPVAHLELRGLNVPSGCSVSDYICYQFGLEAAVDSGNIEMNIDESTKYFEEALRKMKKDGKPSSILVIDDIQVLFANKSSDYVKSSLKSFLYLAWKRQPHL